MSWIENEDGPDCDCDNPTVVKLVGDKAVLLCLFHTQAEGAYIPLPPQRPHNWSDLTIKQVRQLASDPQEQP